MRTVPAAFAAAIASGATSFAHVWRVVRRDGASFAFTDHDRELVFDALLASPLTGTAGGAVEKSADLSVDTASVAGALRAEAIAESDLARGLWDGARVDLYRVDWRDPAVRVHMFAGRIGEVRRGAHAFEAELRGLQAPLNAAVGRVYSRTCDADLGDARCGKNIETAAFRGSAAVGEIVSPTAFRAAGLSGFGDGWFSRGRIAWALGGDSEVALHRNEGAEALIEMLEPTAALAPGAAFSIYAGCDKRFDTCRAKFANSINFRGFPHMPGNDALIAGPAPGDDGGSRFS